MITRLSGSSNQRHAIHAVIRIGIMRWDQPGYASTAKMFGHPNLRMTGNLHGGPETLHKTAITYQLGN
jgi:hypothetical protein